MPRVRITPPRPKFCCDMSIETMRADFAAALLSITVNPFVFKLIDRMGAAPDAGR